MLARATNVAVLLVCLIVGFRVLVPRNGTRSTREEPIDYRGKSVASVRPERDKGGVIVFVSSTCEYCERSVPFYRDLTASLHQEGKSMLVALVGQQPINSVATDSLTAEEYVKSRGLIGAIPVRVAPRDGISARGTPTLLTYDAQGVVTGSWIGLLNPQRQRQLLASLGNN